MEPFELNNNDTIVAVASPSGKGGVALIRVSGNDALKIAARAWRGKKLTSVSSHTVHYGSYISTSGDVLDECVATVFLAPASYTGENTVEFGVHGSEWIQKEILKDLVRRGARMAEPGEFTQRAFLNRKLDLAQAEGVADLISASSKAAHDLAMRQTDGSFSREFKLLREKLVEFASLIELELDFSEEEIEFADRTKLIELCSQVKNKVSRLIDSFDKGKVLKNGVPVVIAGVPNAGKSSLLNLILGTDKAIVTDVPGTTRDLIEDTVELNGILFRFTDTAGIRATNDIVEQIGVNRTFESLEKAYIAVWVLDMTVPLQPQLSEYDKFQSNNPSVKTILLLNKSDLEASADINLVDALRFSTKTGEGLELLKVRLCELAKEGSELETDLIVTNLRHYEALRKAAEALSRVEDGLHNALSGELIAQDIRETLHYLGLITGEITTDNLLHSIFSNFCIGK